MSAPPAPGSAIYRLPSLIEPLSWPDVFGSNQPVELELGSGDGSFLIQYAKRFPGKNLAGVERLLGRFRKIDRKARRHGLGNVRAIRLEASYLLEYLVPRGSLAAIHLYFPDPWPKRRHRGRRLINPDFVESAARALEPAGRIYLRTDDADYFGQMIEVFTPSPLFAEVPTPRELLEIETDFEREFKLAGKQALAVAFELRPPG